MTLAVKKIKYYFGLSFAAAGAVIGFWGFLVLVGKPGTWFQPDKLVALSRIIAGAFAMGLGGHLALSVSRPSRPISDTSLLNTILRTKFWFEALPKIRMRDTAFKKKRKLNVSSVRIKTVRSPVNDNSANDSLTIHTGGGNYNESISGNYNEHIRDYIQGNSITIQGACISMNSDLSEVAAQLVEIVTRLQTQEGYSQEEAKQRVARDLDLATQAQSNRAVRVKLRKWKRSLDEVAVETPVLEITTEVVRAASTPETLPDDLSSTGATKYEKLERLLKARKWREADKETASIILKPLLEEVGELLIHLYIDKYIQTFPGEELRYINNLWFNYSQGRFGFSVQRRIWREVDEDYEAFGDYVGWRVEDDWIYYSDITYSQKAPPGHLPMMVMMIYGLSLSQNSLEYAESVLESFVSRQYRVY
ncbi:GUN4 domain-containing protein [Microcoleus sp. ZQ-A2]